MFRDNFTRLYNERGQSPTQTAVDLGFSFAMPTKWKEDCQCVQTLYKLSV